MNNYSSIQAAFYSEKWMILPETLHMLEQILLERASGVKPSPEEVQARIGSGGYGQSRDSPVPRGVALIPLHGPIVNRAGMFQQMSGMTSPQTFGEMVRAAADDDEVEHIVLDIDTPGGTVSGTHDAAEAVRYAKSKKPVTAVANDLMASAGYYIGSQASKIVALESSGLGSIGVVMAHRDVSAAETMLGMKTTVLYAGKDKAVGNPYGPLSEGDRAKLQTRLDELREGFVRVVAEGRGVDPAEAAERYPDAALYVGQAAIDAGLADEIGTLSGVLASLRNPDAPPPSPAPQPSAQTQQEESMSLKKPDTNASAQDWKAYAESLETAAAETPEAAESIDLSTLSEPMRQRFEALEAEAKANAQAAERAEATANQERDTRMTREFQEKAKAYGNLNMNAQELGGILKRSSESMSAEDYAKFEQTLAAANAQAETAALFAAQGSNGISAEGSAYAEITTKAKELQAKDANLSLEAAIGKVASSEPALYDRYQSELS